MYCNALTLFRLVQGMCLIEISEEMVLQGATTEVYVDKQSMLGESSVADATADMTTVPKVSIQGGQEGDITRDYITRYMKHGTDERQTRQKRSVNDDIAQNHSGDMETVHQTELKSQITPYAFGNPSLPKPSSSDKKKTKRKSPRASNTRQ